MKKSKTILLAAVVVIGSLFTSCSSDDDNSGSSIVGAWKSISSVGETFVNDVLVDSEENIADDKNYATFTFNADGTFTTSEKEEGEEPYAAIGTYTINGNKLSLSYGTDDDGWIDIDDYNFKVSGNTLTIVYSYEDESIKEVATSKFKRQ